MALNIGEALRYMGMENAPSEIREQVQNTANMLCAEIKTKSRFKVFPLEKTDTGFKIESMELCGETAEKMLSECSMAAVMICTLGFEFEAMLRTGQARDMAQAVILDACASALVEAGCDETEAKISEAYPNMYLTDRFSPGYGDLPLYLQSDICGIMDAQKSMGVYLNEAMLLNPSKTVTAIIGISDKPQKAKIRGCDFCGFKENCDFRKGGKSCNE